MEGEKRMAFNSSDIAAFKDIWVFCEQREGKLMNTDFELISEGRKLADERGAKLVGVLLGDNVEGIAKELGGYGADKVIVCNHPELKVYTTDAYAKVLCAAFDLNLFCRILSKKPCNCMKGWGSRQYIHAVTYLVISITPKTDCTLQEPAPEFYRQAAALYLHISYRTAPVPIPEVLSCFLLKCPIHRISCRFPV